MAKQILDKDTGEKVFGYMEEVCPQAFLRQLSVVSYTAVLSDLCDRCRLSATTAMTTSPAW